MTMNCDKFITLNIIYIFCVDQLLTWDSAHNYHRSRSEVNCEGGQIRRGGYRSHGSPPRSSSQRKYEIYHSHFSPYYFKSPQHFWLRQGIKELEPKILRLVFKNCIRDGFYLAKLRTSRVCFEASSDVLKHLEQDSSSFFTQPRLDC